MTAAFPTSGTTGNLPFDPPPETASSREKSPQAFRTISEVGDELDIPAHVLRFWETKFPQLNPMKRGGGRRYYRPADVALLRGIRVALYDEGLTIKGLQKLFRDRGPRYIVGLGDGNRVDGTVSEDEGAAASAPAAGDRSERLSRLVADLVALRDRLRSA